MSRALKPRHYDFILQLFYFLFSPVLFVVNSDAVLVDPLDQYAGLVLGGLDHAVKHRRLTGFDHSVGRLHRELQNMSWNKSNTQDRQNNAHNL